MSSIQKILVRSYFVEHGSLLGVENEPFYKRVFRDGEPSEDDLVELLGVTAKSMRPSTKLAMIEGLSRGDVDFVCTKLGVKTKKECWDLAHFEDWDGLPVVWKKPSLSPEELQLLDCLTTHLSLGKRAILLTDRFEPLEIRKYLYAQAKSNKGKIPKEALGVIKEMIPKFKYKADLPTDFLITGDTVFQGSSSPRRVLVG